ncbi:signal peptide peptidase SppA [Ferrimonas balearica]|uniref:signal peptide peptidase SppA n=1 Tax=Ferrimonas balearica TaxID=44012 RepID=UPI001C99AB4C|nr:signal peptide peptidase SppA [Ferrimonas balearica]MBY5920354.1 signal peptide peptidase SppA [Ferrimonas balearica]MBY5996961.1 signal peptide peptidase SppA [Ferrimonas balearica]
MSTQPSLIKRLFRFVASFLNTTRKVIVNLVFFAVLAIVIVALSGDELEPVPDGGALVLRLDGILVEQKRPLDPMELITGQGNDRPKEILMSDLLLAINEAANDDRISGIVLKPGKMSGGLAKLEEVGQALEQFKESGKPVIAQAGWLDQGNYFLASFADEIQLNPGGVVSIDGFGMYRVYYKEALEKLKVNTHLFRVGKYKSFAESYTRNDMSDEAKEANQAVLTDLWGSYVGTVASNRDLDAAQFSPTLATLNANLEAVGGDMAKLALTQGLVDELKTDIEMREELIERFGTQPDDEHAIKAIGLSGYLAHVRPMLEAQGENQIAIIVAKGTILNGDQPAGTIGGISTSRLLREAREDDKVKAVVLRVDSGGGSAYASEQIRQEVLALQAAGKPVVASMGSVAASGGYWISANADRIFAQPTTITGSIGIIGLITTFEESAAALGIHADGVGTTEMAGLSVLRPLPDGFKHLVQQSLNKGYQDFIQLVSTARNLPLEQVDEIAQGRIWSGKAALENGLVDEMGELDDAIETAANLAQLEAYDTRVIGPKLSPEQEMLQQFFGAAGTYLPEVEVPQWQQVLNALTAPLEAQLKLDDPNHRYLLCLECAPLS